MESNINPILEMRSLKPREGKPCAQGCRDWEGQSQDLNPGVSCPRARVCSWKRLSYSDVNFPSPSPVISLPFRATCAATLWRAHSGSSCRLSPPHLRSVGMWPWTMGDLVFHHLFWEWGPVGPPTCLLPYIKALGYGSLSYRLKTHDDPAAEFPPICGPW